MGCGTSTIKYLLFFFNLVFALAGAALTSLASVVYWNSSYYDDLLGSYVTGLPSLLLIVSGAIIFLVSIFGCVGAIRESQCLLLTFSVMLGAVFVLEVAGATLGFVFVASVDQALRTGMTDLMKLYEAQTTEGDLARLTWNRVQTGFQCCGLDGPADWSMPPPAGPGIAPPDSCSCTVEGYNCFGNIYVNGCHQQLTDFAETAIYVAAGIALAVAIVEVIGIVFSCVLASSIKKKSRYGLKV